MAAGAGFTLLEMLVVLALMGLLAGVALPNFARMLDAYAASNQWAELTSEIDGLPFKAYSESRQILLSDATAKTLLPALPSDWKMKVDGVIRYRENGWCDGGRLTVEGAGERRRFDLSSPQCAVSRS